jgi:hypothetical protein
LSFAFDFVKTAVDKLSLSRSQRTIITISQKQRSQRTIITRSKEKEKALAKCNRSFATSVGKLDLPRSLSKP